MSFTDATGTTHAASYWKIDSFTFQDMPGTGNTGTLINMKGYNSSTSYAAADTPVGNYQFEMPVAPVNGSPTVGAALTGIYDYALTLPFFSGGTDDGLF